MTAIAYKDGILAADCGCTSNDVRTGATKIVHLQGHRGNFLAALAGCRTYIHQVVEYFNQPLLTTPFPDVEKYHENGVNSNFGLFVNLDTRAVYTMSGEGFLLREESPILSTGYCYSFLHGAMCAGASAVEAICLAHVHADGASMGCDYVVINEFVNQDRPSINHLSHKGCYIRGEQFF